MMQWIRKDEPLTVNSHLISNILSISQPLCRLLKDVPPIYFSEYPLGNMVKQLFGHYPG